MYLSLITIFLLAGITLVGIYLAYRFYAPPFKGVRILMYHKLSEKTSDLLTVKISDFEQQIRYLLDHSYSFVTFSQLIKAQEEGLSLPDKTVVLSFDDGYVNNFQFLPTVLNQAGIKATIFLPVNMIGKENEWDGGGEKIMDWDLLHKATTHFEYGLHSYQHHNMAEMSVFGFREDLQKCLEKLNQNRLHVVPVLSYPYGRFPIAKGKRKEFEEVMHDLRLKFAVRIGNKVNKWPIQNPYLLCRIDIRGTDSFSRFKRKVAIGKIDLFQ